MSVPRPASDIYLHLRLAELEVDLCTALAISNALLAALTTTGPQQNLAIHLALDQALSTIAAEDRSGCAEVQAFVTEVRASLCPEAGAEVRMARNLERLIIRKAYGPSKHGGASANTSQTGGSAAAPPLLRPR